MKKDQITLMDLFTLFLKHWWKVLIVAVTSAVIFYFFTAYFIMPTYQSRGSIYVNNNNGTQIAEQYVNLADLATSQQLAFTVIEILTSDTFLEYVQEESGLSYTPAEIKSMIKLEPLNETEIVEVSAITYDPEHSKELVHAVLHNALDEIHRVIGGGNVKIIDEATFAPNPVAPNKAQNAALGFIIGAVLSFLFIFVLNMFDIRIKDNSDLMEIKELPLLGVIPDGDLVRAEVKKNEKR